MAPVFRLDIERRAGIWAGTAVVGEACVRVDAFNVFFFLLLFGISGWS